MAKKELVKQGYDKKTMDRIQKQKAGKTMLEVFVYGSYGALKYNELRSKDFSVGRSFVNSFGLGLVNRANAGILGLKMPNKKQKTNNTGIDYINYMYTIGMI